MPVMLQQEMFRTLNNALSPLGVRITDAGNGQWSISDGHSLTRFQDGVVVPSLIALWQLSMTSCDVSHRAQCSALLLLYAVVIRGHILSHTT